MGSKQSKDARPLDNDLVTVQKYRGETKRGKRHGNGIYMFANGDMYDGGWRKSKKYGKGVYIFSDGRRLEGYFYHDEYIGKEPNERIKQRMAKKKNQLKNPPSLEQNSERNAERRKDVQYITDGVGVRHEQSMRRNKGLRDKYDIPGSTESLDRAQSRRSREARNENSLPFRRAFSFAGRRQRNNRNNSSDFDEAKERRESKRLRESIRQKYNLPRRV